MQQHIGVLHFNPYAMSGSLTQKEQLDLYYVHLAAEHVYYYPQITDIMPQLYARILRKCVRIFKRMHNPAHHHTYAY